MAMEYVIVTFPTVRQVYIDGEKCGQTNDVLRVDPGTHIFTLGPHANYTPESQEVAVDSTSVLAPLEIIFTRKADT